MKKINLVYSMLLSVAMIGCGTSKKDDKVKAAEDSSSDTEKESPIIMNRLDSIPTQKFTVSIEKEQEMIVGANGSAYILPKNCFLDENGNPVNDNLTIEIKEVNTMQDFVMGGISTASNGRLLSTGGSYYFSANANGKSLKINPKNKPTAMLPNTKRDKEMGFFKGKVTAANDVNWISDSVKKETPYMEPFDINKNFTTEMLEVNCFVEAIGQYYKKQGNVWRFTKGAGQVACVGLTEVEDWLVQRMMKRNKILKLLAGKRVVLMDAYNAYVRKYNQELLSDPDYADQELKQGFYDPYQYEIDDFGWYNMDKYSKEKMVEYTFVAQDENKKPRAFVIHLISKSGKMHIRETAGKEGLKYSWPEAMDLEINYYGVSSKQITKKIKKGENKEVIMLALEKK